MKAIDFYLKTKEYLNEMAHYYGVNDLGKYYELTDYKSDWYGGKPLNEMSGVYRQLLFHAQNATMISKIVNFKDNNGIISLVFYDFDLNFFLREYFPAGCDEDKQIEVVVNKLRYSETNPNGLQWETNKSKKNKDAIVKRFVKAALNGAKYLQNFSSKEEFINDLLSHAQNTKSLIKYFIKRMGDKSGFSVALTCDFLKELDVRFNNLAKPDIHIKNVMEMLLNRRRGYYDKEEQAFECIDDFQKVVEEINQSLPDNDKITVYQLDRMIWLACTGNFFLEDRNKFTKKKYLQFLKNDYKLKSVVGL